MRHFTCFVAILAMLSGSASSQSPNATLRGQVLDSSGGTIVGANIDAVNIATNVKYSTKTNAEGMYLLPDLPPATYEIQVSHAGFKTIVKPDVLLNVRDALVINFTLPLGAVSERVTVEGGAPLINTQDATVSTVVDRQFAENLPMNGRSFQTLIQLTPGVVVTTPNTNDGGQFSVNGQRPSSTYWMVDGVSANFGATATVVPGNGAAGELPSFSALGGTNSLVSVDAMQEFRIQTSTYAPEFGRTPGGQVSIVTRSGTNQLHGTLFDYLRNDALDANDWFANSVGLPKPKERQNDFGGTLSGPIVKDHTFYFFSYEGLRLRLPGVALTTVPDASFTPGGTTNSRQTAMSALQPFLNSYPLPNANSPEILCNPNTDFSCPPSGQSGTAAFNSSFSNPATLDAYSIRVDQRLTDKLTLFGRYSYSPSSVDQRGLAALNVVPHTTITTQMATAGATWTLSPTIANDFRFSYGRTHAQGSESQDTFGGAAPIAAPPFPSPFTTGNGFFIFEILGLTNGTPSAVGIREDNLQRQINLVDSLSVQKGRHSLKFGADFRRLSPIFDPTEYSQRADFLNVASAAAGNTFFTLVSAGKTSSLLFHNLGAFAQDTWRIAPRLTLTYGLRWDVDFAPSSATGPSLIAVTGYDVNNLSNLALAPSGTPPFKTTYGNLAPRVGLAYQLSQNPGRETVIRGGFGIFYSLASVDVGSVLSGNYPFGVSSVAFGDSFPLNPTAAAPPPITVASLMQGFTLYAFDPNLKLPYTLQWNFALEQAIGPHQTFTATYAGAAGRRLLQTAALTNPSATFPVADLEGNTGTSDYNALQIQFQRRLSHGFQALASYSWSHSIDTGSAGSYANSANTLVPSLGANANRGASDFDVRHTLSAGLTYELPAPRPNAFTNAILHGWSLQSFILARSGPPEDIYYLNTFPTAITGAATNIRPDLVPNEPLYLYGSQYPGGKAFNPAAFTPPPADANGNALRQGNLGRNSLRAFGATQWDFAVHRSFPIRESLRLEFRSEMFNVLNHPNFGPPSPVLDQGGFGLSTQMLGQSLSGGGVGGGGFNALYQIGGPRSIQFALKLLF